MFQCCSFISIVWQGGAYAAPKMRVLYFEKRNAAAHHAVTQGGTATLRIQQAGCSEDGQVAHPLPVILCKSHV